jgi:hypothetical protein
VKKSVASIRAPKYPSDGMTRISPGLSVTPSVAAIAAMPDENTTVELAFSRSQIALS